MWKRFVAAVIASLLAASALAQTAAGATVADAQLAAQAAEQQAAPEEAAPEKILVVGQRPGPGLWKVSNGDHVLWVFGTYSPLPKKMEWRSQEVEAILAKSQEMLWPPSPKVPLFQIARALPFAIGADKNPDGALLKDVLPPDMYARWIPLRDKYIWNHERIERRRPVFAAGDLFGNALDKHGLASGRDVTEAIARLAEKNRLKITKPQVDLSFDSPVQSVRNFKKSSLDDLACFSKTIERLETDLEAMRIRANAWARGDLETIRKLVFVDGGEACHSAIMNSAMMKDQPQVQSLDARMQQAWVAAAELALANNASTFAVMPLKRILDPKGVLADLQARGYQVEAPE
ncbi:TraB/GumN family protein [Massilia sp. RP-1-19]|uniref:TraB/GumN family protein n=1 Tax=Massilia polaris TaxID=2728846 RepID=A0A848HHX4_9BURK|nr:TraB/GumN family protein [Massilia polaris]NML61476.1 TraB/GumN family protein [Massilia polaris]